MNNLLAKIWKIGLVSLIMATPIQELLAEEDLKSALRRAQYLLDESVPTDQDFTDYSGSKGAYDQAVRNFINGQNFYNVMMRYHQRIFGVGLPLEYIEELLKEDIDNKRKKSPKIMCERSTGPNARFRCFWASTAETDRSGGCPPAWEEAASVFWYPGIVAWVCPTIMKTCGLDLSQCFIQHSDENEARNSELGTTEAFDSRYAVISSLSRQSAGLATAVVVDNYPYTKILEPGLTAIDGAIAHFYRQSHHFKISELQIDPQVLDIASKMNLTGTRFQLVKTPGDNYASGGVLTTFGWLRRYDKNRTRANMLYERLLCRKFTSDLPAVFPQDPGNLREAVGCSGCHSVLDPLADFFKVWGEEGNLYIGGDAQVNTYFSAAGCTGSSVADLAQCIQKNEGFATCQVHHVWSWLMGRTFYKEEDTLRSKLTEYFIKTDFSMKELIYAVATHPAFVDGARGNGEVDDPLEEPPLGQLPGEHELVCDKEVYTWADDVKPGSDALCARAGCHNGASNLLSLASETDWNSWVDASIASMGTGRMPMGNANADTVREFSDSVRCWKEHR